MCEIFGFCSKTPQRIDPFLKRFFSHAPQHPNGWGLALESDTGIHVEKEPLRADRSRYLRERLRDPAETRTALAHIRLATIGNVEWRNCHPFQRRDNSGRIWTLVHNGTIFEYAPMDDYVRRQHGETDSERILWYLTDQINAQISAQGRPLSAEERFALMDAQIRPMAARNKLNLLLYDGELLYAHTNCADTLYSVPGEDGICIATRPLDDRGWTPFPFLQLLAFCDGALRFEGTPHQNEYIEDPRNLDPLYLAYSGL